MYDHDYDGLLTQLQQFESERVPQHLCQDMTDPILSKLTALLVEGNKSILPIVRLLCRNDKEFCIQLISKACDCIPLIISLERPPTDITGLKDLDQRLDIFRCLVFADPGVCSQMSAHKMSASLAAAKPICDSNKSQGDLSLSLIDHTSLLMQKLLFVELGLDDVAVVEDYVEIIIHSMTLVNNLIDISQSLLFSHISLLDLLVYKCDERKVNVVKLIKDKNLVVSAVMDLLNACSITCAPVTLLRVLKKIVTDASYRVESFSENMCQTWGGLVKKKVDLRNFSWVLPAGALMMDADETMILKHPALVSNFFENERLQLTKSFLERLDSSQNFLHQRLNAYEIRLIVEHWTERRSIVGKKDLIKKITDKIEDEHVVHSNYLSASAKCVSAVIEMSGGRCVGKIIDTGILRSICKALKIEARNGFLTIRNADEMLYNWLMVLEKISSIGIDRKWAKENTVQLRLLGVTLKNVRNCVNTSEKSLKLVESILSRLN